MRPIDLTLTVSGSVPSFPGSPATQFLTWADLGRDGYNLELLFLSSHTGTHIDAPLHFVRGGAGVDRIPLRRLAGRGLLVRMPRPANSPITVSDMRSFEARHGEIPAGASVFLYTGWQKNLGRDCYFLENPGLDARAARHLASRKVNMVGTDSPSIDLGRARSFPAHRILAENGILIVENLANLDRIPSPGFDFVIMPLKLKGASGSPVRAVAYAGKR